MRTTLLDDLIITCEKNASVLPAMQHMREIIQETTPVAHRWEADIAQYTGELYQLWGQTFKGRPSVPAYVRYGLPAGDPRFPDRMMCLFGDKPLVTGYKFCIDVGVDEFTKLMGASYWYLEGAMVFQQQDDMFELIPLVRNARGPVLIEVQLHYVRKGDVWEYSLSSKGPINPMFHRWFMEKMTDDQRKQTNDNIQRLGAIMTLYIGSYIAYVRQPGTYAIYPARDAKCKIKNGQLKKIYRPASVGYKQFEPRKDDHEIKDRHENTELATQCETHAVQEASADESGHSSPPA